MRALRGALAVAIAVFASCAIYDTSLLVEGDAGVDANVVVDAGADVDPCNHAEPPTRPTADDTGDAGDLELVTALTSVDFNLTTDAGVYGFDLDHTCTCPAPESCTPQKGASQHCDDSRGRDNAGGALIQQFSQLTTALDINKVNAKIADGLNTMMLRVRGYNGTANDTQVAVAVFVSNGTVPLTDAGADPMPKHDGTDLWSVDPTSVTGTPPPYVAVNEDPAGYVSNGVLVASVSFPFGLGTTFGPNFLRLDGAFLVATLTKSQTGYFLAGTITGRWDTRNLLTGLQGVKDPFNAGQFLCGTDPTYVGFKAAICAASDIARSSGSDSTGAPCDALSLAVGFTAEPAMLDGLLSGSVGPTPCGATYSDQCGN